MDLERQADHFCGLYGSFQKHSSAATKYSMLKTSLFSTASCEASTMPGGQVQLSIDQTTKGKVFRKNPGPLGEHCWAMNQAVRITSNLQYNFISHLVCCLQRSQHFDYNVRLGGLSWEEGKQESKGVRKHGFCIVQYSLLSLNDEGRLTQSDFGEVNHFQQNCSQIHTTILLMRDRYVLENKLPYLAKKFNFYLQSRSSNPPQSTLPQIPQNSPSKGQSSEMIAQLPQKEYNVSVGLSAYKISEEGSRDRISGRGLQPLKVAGLSPATFNNSLSIIQGIRGQLLQLERLNLM